MWMRGNEKRVNKGASKAEWITDVALGFELVFVFLKKIGGGGGRGV